MKTSSPILECKPIGCYWSGHKHKSFYAIKISGGRYKGSPWVLAYVEDNFFRADCHGFRTYKSACKELKEADLERSTYTNYGDATPLGFHPDDKYIFAQ